MKKTAFLLVLVVFAQLAKAQTKTNTSTISKPKLVVGIVIDQMRWDYLYRFQPLFKANGGFKRMMGEGFSCDNTMIPYAPTVTACGHTCVYTGSVPAIHGIAGNAWWDNQLNRIVYCSEDKSVKTVGSNTDAGQMSPKNMLTTSICDELRISSNFKSKVIGVALKDRGSILPAGHSANAAYWYDSKTGNFITSSYYMNALPQWVNQFNQRKLVDSLYALGWKTALSKETLANYATDDVKSYEGKPFGKDAIAFPYDFTSFIGKDYSKISTTPHGNSLTAEMAKAAVIAEQLGKGSATDFLAVSFSSTDYIGHSFGPNSWEHVDDYVKLDDELGKLLNFLDAQVGKNQYTVFLTADHAVAHVPGFMKEHKLPGGNFDDNTARKEMNDFIKEKYGVSGAVESLFNYQVTLNHAKLDSAKADLKVIKQQIISMLLKKEAVSNAFETANIMATSIPKVQREMFANGYFPNRGGDVQFILKSGYMEGGSTGTTHGLWAPYDAHIPLLFYGWGIKKGSSHKEVYMTDIAPTVAALLKIQMPSGNIGHVITDVLK
ncbi:MAG: alkaline phosphatase family protein [Bacteroidetes bacterium 24-39-8]|nr:MAG: alkaline phosphatase family protein [Sphingobacteriia bacterium 35-40-8]OYZ50771.1 MAG: alkaline phosphatase family protein [Bacteroidetes bacterium 24-39-8]HQR93188.1 alkaline phosphatase family protein [Sediminibacterium sp.]HQS54161.1 alkaline phosphatase family protein [Sediminibacterium sp.]